MSTVGLIHRSINGFSITSSLESNTNASDAPILKSGKTFKLKNGGRFISDPTFIKDEEIPEILDLFTSFLVNVYEIQKILQFGP